MAGIEVAGLVFGVVPVVVETLKSYSFLRNKLHSCRHYSEEVEEIAARFTSARANFNNEIQLLRRCLKGKTQAEGLEDDVDSALKESYQSCISTIDRTRKILEKMQTETLKFDELLTKKSQGQSMRKLRTMIKVSVNESRYERLLVRLRERNNELTAFRLQIEALRQPDPRSAGICIQHKALPVRFCTVQVASKHLHAVLEEAWSCDNNVQRNHHAKLCLDAEVADAEIADEVHLDIAISCQESCGKIEPNARSQAEIWLYVQSSTSSIVESDPLQPSVKVDHANVQDQNSKLSGYDSSLGRSTAIKKKASSDLSSQSHRKKKKAKKVQWAPPTIVDSAPIPASHKSVDAIADLRGIGNICSFLRMQYSARAVSPEIRCVGYLLDSSSYRHSFYFRDGIKVPDLNISGGANIFSVEDALERDVYDFIGMVDQLRMARKLAVAVLQYNGTPWLPDHWRLPELKYLGLSDRMDAVAMRTLHLNSEIVKQPNAAKMQGIKQAKDAVSNQMRQGITNSTLFCLGVALLEIAYWSPIEAKATKHDEKNPVLTARRLQADRSPPLGIKYQKIAKQCLSCDFGFGDQLSEKGLQSAVYTNVVCGLEDLITEFTELGIK